MPYAYSPEYREMVWGLPRGEVTVVSQAAVAD